MQWERERHHEMEETETESVRSALLEASPTTAAAALATTATLPATVVVVGKYFKVAVNSQHNAAPIECNLCVCMYVCLCVCE